MSFTWVKRGAERPAFSFLSDGHLKLLGFYRPLDDSRIPNPSQQHTALFWRGKVPSLYDLYAHYLAFVAELSKLDPRHADEYCSACNISVTLQVADARL
ncbi:MAG TPA: hypothetical protein VN495_00860 [Candidatus Paceibacterota bacterium]|nr:hypothetical protein [Candidatus Paceibacterota bacterium]